MVINKINKYIYLFCCWLYLKTGRNLFLVNFGRQICKMWSPQTKISVLERLMYEFEKRKNYFQCGCLTEGQHQSAVAPHRWVISACWKPFFQKVPSSSKGNYPLVHTAIQHNKVSFPANVFRSQTIKLSCASGFCSRRQLGSNSNAKWET